MNNTLKRLYHQAPTSAAICIVLTVIYTITAIQSRSLSNNLDNSSIGNDWALYPPVMGDNLITGPLRAFGGMVLHSGATHLIFNGFILYFLGREIERVLGGRALLLLFIASGLGGALAVMLLNPYSVTVGASGAGYGFMAMFVAISARYRLDLRAPLVLIAANMVFTLITPGVSLWGHVGGLLAGALFGALFYFLHNPRTRDVLYTCCALALYAAIVLLSAAYGM